MDMWSMSGLSWLTAVGLSVAFVLIILLLAYRMINKKPTTHKKLVIKPSNYGMAPEEIFSSCKEVTQLEQDFYKDTNQNVEIEDILLSIRLKEKEDKNK
jgi:hypothetical protein